MHDLKHVVFPGLLSALSPQPPEAGSPVLAHQGAARTNKAPFMLTTTFLFALAILKGMCEQCSKVWTDAPLLLLKRNCYYYVLRSINGPAYWIFSPPPGDEWASTMAHSST